MDNIKKIDLLLLHRPDVFSDFDEIARAMQFLKEQNLVDNFHNKYRRGRAAGGAAQPRHLLHPAAADGGRGAHRRAARRRHRAPRAALHGVLLRRGRTGWSGVSS